MFTTTARTVCAALFLSLSAAPGLLQAQDKPPAQAIESFYDTPAFQDAILSPNGKHLAVLIAVKQRRLGLYVLDLATNQGTLVAQFNDTDIGDVQWVNSERLLFDTRDRAIGQRDVSEGPGMFAVNRDGSNLRQLVHFAPSFLTGRTIPQERHVLPYHTFMLGQAGAQNSDYVYVKSHEWDENTGDLKTVDLLRLNTVTGKSQPVKRPPNARGWLLDHNGEPRVCWSYKENQQTVYYRDKADGEWVAITSGDAYTEDGLKFTPLAFGPNNTLYVETNAGGRDKSAIFLYDYQTGKLSDKPMIETAGYDFRGHLISDKEKVLGMSFVTDARSTLWFDPRMKAVQQRIDDILKSTVNLVDVAARSETPWVTVTAYSDRQPEVYYLFNTDTNQLRKIADSRPGIDPTLQGSQQQVTVKARDGLTFPSLLTLPNGKRSKLPLVVLVHGGPWVDGAAWGWDQDAQFLASRGYAVIEPSFRGTTGLGQKHYRASWKQWGLAMQDDVADAAKWAIDNGYADANRVCIAGASYGGYATLMGLIKHPDLYKCGINWVGVSDIELMAKGDWTFTSDMSESYLKHGLPVLVGDVVKDAEQLKATSPLAQAHKLKQPLLMAYGAADRRVPLYHGDKFMKAVKPHNPNVELIVYPEEGHGWVLPKNRYDFYSRMVNFLDKHIGTPNP